MTEIESQGEATTRNTDPVPSEDDDTQIGSQGKLRDSEECFFGKSKLLPVLIIPGFMSSGLEVTKSGLSERWVGKRVWINLVSLGIHSLAIKGAGHASRDRAAKAIHNGSEDMAQAEESQKENDEQTQLKSAWIYHMTLSDDLYHERDGNAVRPIPGLDGVDYLTDDKLSQFQSYVFGPVIRALKEIGYRKGVNLDAAPYDWRIPPSRAEERDGYLTSTMKRIEQMYRENDNTPVVLLCHSLGAKMGHYFLNFAKVHPHGGQQWLDKHIHTYMPVGPDNLGAPSIIRYIVVRSELELDAFLSEEDGLILSRSFGSAPWMMPRKLPVGVAAIPSVICRREGKLEVTITSLVNCEPLFRRRKCTPSKFRLCVSYGPETLVTGFKRAQQGGLNLSFSEKFCFASPADVRLDKLQFFLQEPGDPSRHAEDKQSGVDIFIRCLCCPIKWVCCFPCTFVCCAAHTLSCVITGATAAVLRSARIVATSTKLSLRDTLFSNNSTHEKTFPVKFYYQRDLEKPHVFRKVRSTSVKVTAKWVPLHFPEKAATEGCPVAELPSNDVKTLTPEIQVLSSQDLHARYDAKSGRELMQAEGLENFMKLIKDRYEKDPLGPRTLSAEDAPPVKRVKAIYGVNVATEVSAVFCLRPAWIEGANRKAESRHVVDKSARLASRTSLYQLKDGIVYETRETPQFVIEGNKGKTLVYRSGDGTVPYWNLRHCRSWHGQCDVSVEEIDGAKHREILADVRFHRILKKYLVLKDEDSTEIISKEGKTAKKFLFRAA